MSLTRRIILLTLSLLVLTSSVGLSVGLHLCGDTIQDMAFFHKAEACPMEKPQKPLPCHSPEEQEAAADDMGCCKDNVVVADSHDDAFTSKASVDIKQPDLKLLATLQTVLVLFLTAEEPLQPAYHAYSPPPIVRDIPVLVQSFLI